MKRIYNLGACIPSWHFSQDSFTFYKIKQLLIYVELNLNADTRIID